MTTLANSYLPDMMARHRLQDHTIDDGPASSLYEFLPGDANQGLSFSITEPLRDQYSGDFWLLQTVGGPQNFQTTYSPSGVSKGYRQNPQTGARSRASRNGTAPGMDEDLFNNNIPRHWKAHQNAPIYGAEEMTPFSKSSLDSMGSTADMISGSDRPGTLDSYSVTSDQLDVPDCSSNMSDTALYTGSTIYSEFSEFVDEEDTIPRNGSFRNGLSGGVNRRSSHLNPIANGSPLQMFTTGSEENIYTTGAEIMPQTVAASAVHSRDYRQDFAWIAGDHTGQRNASPTYSVSGLSIPMSRSGSALDSLPPYKVESPRSARKSMVSNHSQINEDAYINTEPLNFYEDMAFNDRGRRQGDASEIDSVARDHPYYHSATLGQDGLYHCPWETVEPPCSHKPEKLKCNYDKCVDSHLKPYRCKVQSCGESRFSSTACLLRHEREAHAMHGHGEKPFLCTAENCDRSILGNGFPRHWNLRDHMKRVHNTVPEPTDSDQPARGARKRKTSSVEGKTRKKNSAHSPPKESAQPMKREDSKPVKNELSPEGQFLESRRQLISAMELLNDPNDPEAFVKLQRANKCLMDMAATSEKMARTNSPTG